MTKQKTIYTSSFKIDTYRIHVSHSNDGLCSLYFIKPERSAKQIEDDLMQRIPSAQLTQDADKSSPYIEEIKSLWARHNPQAKDMTFDLYGTEFQKTVWRALQDIKSGETKTYSQLAHDIGRPKATRAVASAVAKNPISILIPCHRILPKSGGVGQYAGGSEIKKALLEYEGAI